MKGDCTPGAAEQQKRYAIGVLRGHPLGLQHRSEPALRAVPVSRTLDPLHCTASSVRETVLERNANSVYDPASSARWQRIRKDECRLVGQLHGEDAPHGHVAAIHDLPIKSDKRILTAPGLGGVVPAWEHSDATR